MTANDTADVTSGQPAGESVNADEELDHAARAELLAEENRRLRTEYTRAQQSKYRQTAYGLAAIGCLAVLGGFLFPNGREVLFALAATGLFGGILTLYLTPTQFVTADVGERVYAAMAANEHAIADELGLADNHQYIPGGENSARLYIPQNTDFDIPTGREGPIIVDDGSRGLLLEPTGSLLFEEFERALSGELAGTPATLAEQLADGIVEQFELASAVRPDVDDADGRATFEITGSAFGDLDRIDHPIVSFLAVGFVVALAQSVSIDITSGGKRVDWLVTYRWDVDSSE